MKVKFTYRRTGGAPVDLVATIDSATTVGDLAEHLVAADPERRAQNGAPVAGQESTRATLTITDRETVTLDPDLLITDSRLRSGVEVAIGRSGSLFTGASDTTAAAVMRVIAGPDVGRQFQLPRGSATIGRDSDCDVVLKDSMVSRRHARVNVSDVVEVIDLGSANGVSVGEATLPRATLRPSDVVRLGDTELSVSVLHTGAPERGAQSEFLRSPTVQPRFEGEVFEAPAPPERTRPQRFPTIALLAPLLIGAVLYAVTRSPTSLIFIALTPLMLIGSALESRLSSRAEFKRAVEAFRADQQSLEEELRASSETEVAARRAEHPLARTCLEAVDRLSPATWSRRPDLPGFAEVTFGLGVLDSRSKVELPRMARSPHGLFKELKDAFAPYSVVHGVPVHASLQDSAVGVGGPRSLALPLTRSLVVQLAALHSPAELVMTAFLSGDSAVDWDWMKWLPHTTSPHSPLTVQHLTSTRAASGELVAALEELSTTRAEADEDPLPAVVVLVENDSSVERGRLVALAERGPALGIHVIWSAPDVALLPAACKVYAAVDPGGGAGRVGFVHAGRTAQPVDFDAATAEDAAAFARRVSPLVDAGALATDESDLPRAVSQLALLGPDVAERPEVVIERWQQNSSVLTGPFAPAQLPREPGNLRAVVGQSSAGHHALDLRRDGPHALVGGTTGAGKSELLQSWILSLAAAHSPERVTFLLVDYKGGSAFSECVQLPHTIGLVTDLSQHLVRRALTSLKAELRYREELLAEHDAKDLQALESQGFVGAPPSLIIVVDEFAALIKEVPEFVDGVVDVAQRGRSLGLHLILATQRPAGVIKDNLRANTNLRVALRMADEADSIDVLGLGDAAGFDPGLPGRGMSKSGPRRLTPFQTAYAGGWTTEAKERPEVIVEELGTGARVGWKPAATAEPAVRDREQTDIKRLVRTIRAAREVAELPVPRKAWLSELAPTYNLVRIHTSRDDSDLVFAIADDPARQAQPPVGFHPDREGNLVVYGTGGSGKSAFLRSVATAAGLTARSGPCHVYGLDFGSRGLSMLEALPHVGSIVAGSDHERLTRLLRWLRETIDERAARYSKVNAGTITQYRTLAGAGDEARILLLVDGIAAFRASYETTTDRVRWLEMLTSIASEGRPVGVHVVLSSETRSGLPTALASAVQRRVVLRLAAEEDYAWLGVPADVLTLQSPPGRGLVGDREVQVAVLGGVADPARQAAETAALASAMREAGVQDAAPIQSLTERAHLDDLPAAPGGLVIGIASDTLGPVAIEPRAGFLVSGPPQSGRTTTLHTLACALQRLDPRVELHLLSPTRSSLAQLPIWTTSAVGIDQITTAASGLAAQLASGTADSRVAVFLESAGELVSSPAELHLQQLVKACAQHEQLFVAEGESSTLTSTMGFLGAVKASRRGLILQPDQENGMGLLKTPFPRISRAEYPPGRGMLVGAGRAAVVQVALPPGSSHG